jgi:hypothetical protein
MCMPLVSVWRGDAEVRHDPHNFPSSPLPFTPLLKSNNPFDYGKASHHNRRNDVRKAPPLLFFPAQPLSESFIAKACDVMKRHKNKRSGCGLRQCEGGWGQRQPLMLFYTYVCVCFSVLSALPMWHRKVWPLRRALLLGRPQVIPPVSGECTLEREGKRGEKVNSISQRSKY